MYVDIDIEQTNVRPSLSNQRFAPCYIFGGKLFPNVRSSLSLGYRRRYNYVDLSNRLITVHQASLLIDPNTYQAKVELHCLNSPAKARLRSSQVILINSARKIADLLLRLIDQNVHSRILGPTVTMVALMILGCHIMKDAGEQRNRADLEVSCVTRPFITTSGANIESC
jgi:hypothetical protein